MAFGCMIVNVNFIKLYVSWTWRQGNDLMDLGGNGQRTWQVLKPFTCQIRMDPSDW